MTAPPGPAELLAARRFVSEHHPRTALRPLGDGDAVLVKCENEGPVRSFKARGALWSLASLGAGARERGVVTASTGNHSQGVAFAGRRLGIPAVIAMPVGTSELKLRRTRALGGDVRLVEGDLTAAEHAARAIARDERRHYLEDGEDPALMAGAATVAWEIFDGAPDVDVLVVPVGGGNLIAGVSLVAKRINPAVRVVGVQSSAAPAVARSWDAGTITEAPCETAAGGLATTHPGRLAFSVIREHVDELHLVDEDALRANVLARLEASGQLVELAAAAGFALLERERERWRDRRVVIVQSGGNLGLGELAELLNPRVAA
jgi:threonine dehydratase